MFRKILLFCFVAALFSCSDDETYDKAKAISIFANSRDLQIDENLAKQDMRLPKQQKNGDCGVGVVAKNSEIENLEFAPIIAKKAKNQKFLTKYHSKWSGSRPIFLSNRFVFAPIIKDDKIFLLDARGNLESYDLTNKKRIFKKRLFKRRYLKNYQNPKIGYFDNAIYAIAGSNEIVAASAVSGEILWSKSILSLPISKPISDGKMVYVTTADSKTYALNAQNGDLIWVSSGVDKPTSIFGAADPVISQNKLIVAYSSGEIYALNKQNGEEIFSQSLNFNRAIDSDFYLNDIDATPIVKNDTIFAISNGGLMMAIDAKSGNYIWKKQIASISDFWAAGEFLFVVDGDDKLIVLSQKTGNIRSILQLPDYKNAKKVQTKIIYNGVILAGDKLLISDVRGRILVVDPKNNKLEQEFKVGKKIYHSPIVVDGKVYLHAVGGFTVKLIEIW